MMPQSKDKSLKFYIILFIFLGTLNNQYFKIDNLFEINDISLNGLDTLNKNKLLQDLKVYKFSNIFNIEKNSIKNLIEKNKLVETFKVSKIYPSELKIKINKTKFLANINIDGKFYFIGSNKKLIQTDEVDKILPFIFGKSSVEDFIKLHKKIVNSSLKFTDINNLYFFPSTRWDIEFKNGNILKLPINYSVIVLNNYHKISQSEYFLGKKIFDMRIKNQLIINDL